VQAVCLLSELKQTQRSVVKCLSEAEQAKKEYDELKHKTQLIMMQLEQVTLTHSIQTSSQVHEHFFYVIFVFETVNQ
jgi:hypothetical protein